MSHYALTIEPFSVPLVVSDQDGRDWAETLEAAVRNGITLEDIEGLVGDGPLDQTYKEIAEERDMLVERHAVLEGMINQCREALEALTTAHRRYTGKAVAAHRLALEAIAKAEGATP